MQRAAEDSLPTIARPPTRDEMVPVFLQRDALQDGHPGSGPVSLADGGLLPQGKPPDADLQGGEVGVSPMLGSRRSLASPLAHAL